MNGDGGSLGPPSSSSSPLTHKRARSFAALLSPNRLRKGRRKRSTSKSTEPKREIKRKWSISSSRSASGSIATLTRRRSMSLRRQQTPTGPLAISAPMQQQSSLSSLITPTNAGDANARASASTTSSRFDGSAGAGGLSRSASSVSLSISSLDRPPSRDGARTPCTPRSNRTSTTSVGTSRGGNGGGGDSISDHLASAPASMLHPSEHLTIDSLYRAGAPRSLRRMTSAPSSVAHSPRSLRRAHRSLSRHDISRSNPARPAAKLTPLSINDAMSSSSSPQQQQPNSPSRHNRSLTEVPVSISRPVDLREFSTYQDLFDSIKTQAAAAAAASSSSSSLTSAKRSASDRQIKTPDAASLPATRDRSNTDTAKLGVGDLLSRAMMTFGSPNSKKRQSPRSTDTTQSGRLHRPFSTLRSRLSFNPSDENTASASTESTPSSTVCADDASDVDDPDDDDEVGVCESGSEVETDAEDAEEEDVTPASSSLSSGKHFATVADRSRVGSRTMAVRSHKHHGPSYDQLTLKDARQLSSYDHATSRNNMMRQKTPQVSPGSLSRSVSSPSIASKQNRPKLAGVFDQLIMSSSEFRSREKQLEESAHDSSHFQSRLASAFDSAERPGSRTDSPRAGPGGRPPALALLRMRSEDGTSGGSARSTPRRRRGYTMSGGSGSISRPLSPMGRGPPSSATVRGHRDAAATGQNWAATRDRAATVSGKHRRAFTGGNAPTANYLARVCQRTRLRKVNFSPPPPEAGEGVEPLPLTADQMPATAPQSKRSDNTSSSADSAHDLSGRLSPGPRHPIMKESVSDPLTPMSRKMVTLISPAPDDTFAFSNHRHMATPEALSDSSAKKHAARTFSSPDLSLPTPSESRDNTPRNGSGGGLSVRDLRGLMRRHKNKSRSLPDSLVDLPVDQSGEVAVSTGPVSKRKSRTSSLDAGASRKNSIEPAVVPVTSPRILFSDSTLKKHKRKHSRSRDDMPSVASISRRSAAGRPAGGGEVPMVAPRGVRITPDPRSIQGSRLRANSRQRALSPPSRSKSRSSATDMEPILSQKSIKNRKLRISPSSSPGPLHPSNASATSQTTALPLPQAQPTPHHTRAQSSMSSFSNMTNTPSPVYSRAVHLSHTKRLGASAGHSRSKSNHTHFRRHSQLSTSTGTSSGVGAVSSAAHAHGSDGRETRSRTSSAHVRAPSTHTPASLFTHRRTHTRDSSHTSASSQSSMSSRASSETLEDSESPHFGGDAETNAVRSMLEEFKLSPASNKRFSLSDNRVSPSSTGSYTFGPSSGARFRRKTSMNAPSLPSIDSPGSPVRTAAAAPRTSPFPLPRKDKSYSPVQIERELTFDYDPATHSMDLAASPNPLQGPEYMSDNSPAPSRSSTLQRKKGRRSPSISLVVGSITGLATRRRSQTVKLRKKDTRSPVSLPPFPQNRPIRGTPLSSSAPELDTGARSQSRSKQTRIVFPEDVVLANALKTRKPKRPFGSPTKRSLRRSASESGSADITVGHTTHDNAVAERWNQQARERQQTANSLLAPTASSSSEVDKSRSPTNRSHSAHSSPMRRGYARRNLVALARSQPHGGGHLNVPAASPSSSTAVPSWEDADEDAATSGQQHAQESALDVTDSFSIATGDDGQGVDVNEERFSIRSHPSKSRLGSVDEAGADDGGADEADANDDGSEGDGEDADEQGDAAAPDDANTDNGASDQHHPSASDGPTNFDVEFWVGAGHESLVDASGRIMYNRGKQIGRGGSGKVFTGLVNNGEVIAVKQIEISDSAETSQMENEIRVMSKLRHPNVVSLYGFERRKKRFNILMEFVPGHSLHSRLQQFGKLQEAVIQIYTRQIVEALVYIHENNIIHRDLKSSNILMNSNQCKVSDFGSAKQTNDQFKDTVASKNFAFTTLWLAPEVITKGKYNHKSDIWSLACIVIEMATAKQPWHEVNLSNPFAIMFHIGQEGNRPAIPKTLSPCGQEFLESCFERRVERRPTAADLLQHAWLQQGEGPPSVGVCI